MCFDCPVRYQVREMGGIEYQVVLGDREGWVAEFVAEFPVIVKLQRWAAAHRAMIPLGYPSEVKERRVIFPMGHYNISIHSRPRSKDTKDIQ